MRIASAGIVGSGMVKVAEVNGKLELIKYHPESFYHMQNRKEFDHAISVAAATLGWVRDESVLGGWCKVH